MEALAVRAVARFPRCSFVSVSLSDVAASVARCPVCCWPSTRWTSRWICPASHRRQRRLSSSFLSVPLGISAGKWRQRYLHIRSHASCPPTALAKLNFPPKRWQNVTLLGVFALPRLSGFWSSPLRALLPGDPFDGGPGRCLPSMRSRVGLIPRNVAMGDAPCTNVANASTLLAGVT